jgi:elongation factor G
MKKFQAVSDLLRIRNLGVVAHIDAGKTTLTERMLYYCGAVARPGNVDDGDTVTDYLSQERERGITIRAAAISFKWREFQLNLVDTPGHIDFNGEVERALRVMDGGVVVIDSSKGVETQTKTVWRQCDKFQVPRLIFCNKLDTGGALLEVAANSLKVRPTQTKLKIKPLLMQLPLGQELQYRGHIDLVRQLAYEYCCVLGDKVDVTPVAHLDLSLRAKAIEAREELLDQVATLDDEFAVGD